MSVDQTDVSNQAAIEHIIRRLVQIELAVERCPTRPDFTGLDLLTDGTVSTRGAARADKFSTWLAERQRDRAQVFKQRRLCQEELANARKLRENESGPEGGGQGKTDKKNKKSNKEGGE